MMSFVSSLRIVAPVLGLLALVRPGEAAPSFDCTGATLPIELALCTNAALGDLEGEMTRLYQERLAEADAATADRLQRDMRRWLGRLTRDCGVPRSGSFADGEIARAAPCLEAKYRDRIAALQPPAEPATAAEPPPEEEGAGALDPAAASLSEPAAGSFAAAMPSPQSDGVSADTFAWQAAPYAGGLVAIIARINGSSEYATASVYCDSQYPERVPVFLYRLGSPVPSAEEVRQLNQALDGARLIVDGREIQSVGRDDLGRRFSGLQLLADGTLAYMLLIDPAVLEEILHGQQLQAVLQLPAGQAGVFAAETFPLKNSRKAIEAAMQQCIAVAGAPPA